MTSPSKLNVVTFASGRYEGGRQRLLRSIERFAPARCWNFSVSDFRKTEVCQRFPKVTRAVRGAGYWLWKPYYILEVLRQIPEGELLLYLDAGFEVTADLGPLLDLVRNDPGMALFKVHDRLNRHWTKRDCFLLMNCDSQEFLDIEQSMSGIVLIRKTELAERLVREWLAYATDERAVTDAANVCGLPNYSGFVEHRHDQSILANLGVRYGVPVYADPSQYGDPFRASAIPGVDDYPALLNLHRERAPSWRTALRLLKTDRTRFMIAASRHISRLGRSAAR